MWEANLLPRRDLPKLVYEVLCVAFQKSASKYRIMCEARLNFWQAESIVSFLVENGHLALDSDGNGVKQYLTTEKGEQLRGFIREIQEELDGLSIHSSGSDTPSGSRVSSTYAEALAGYGQQNRTGS